MQRPLPISWAYWALMARCVIKFSNPLFAYHSFLSFEGLVLVLSLYRGFQYSYRRDRIPMLTNISPIQLRDSAIYSFLCVLTTNCNQHEQVTNPRQNRTRLFGERGFICSWPGQPLSFNYDDLDFGLIQTYVGRKTILILGRRCLMRCQSSWAAKCCLMFAGPSRSITNALLHCPMFPSTPWQLTTKWHRSPSCKDDARVSSKILKRLHKATILAL